MRLQWNVTNVIVAVEEIGLWWLSFADHTGPLGVCIVEGVSLDDAIERSTVKGINPLSVRRAGDSIMGIPVPHGNPIAMEEANRLGKDRLITPVELRDDDYRTRSELMRDGILVDDLDRMHGVVYE